MNGVPAPPRHGRIGPERVLVPVRGWRAPGGCAIPWTMFRTVRDWTCSIVFVVVFGLSMLLFDVALRIASLFGKRAESWVAGVCQVWLLRILGICNIRLEVERSPLVRDDETYIVVANHQSMFDMPIYASVLFWNYPKYISKVELAKWIPTVSFHLRSGGHAIIDRKDRDSAVKAIDKLGREIVEEGFSAVIFPEGTRARDGALKPFKPAGTVALLRQAREARVVPACVDESWRLMAGGMLPLPWGLRLRAWVGDPIDRRADEDPYALVAEAERRIADAIARMRGGIDATAAGAASAWSAERLASTAGGSGSSACAATPDRRDRLGAA